MRKTRYMAFFLFVVLLISSISVPAKAADTGLMVQSITLNMKSKETMYVGASRKVKVSAVSPKGSSKKVNYTSSDPSVVKVTDTGTMKALSEGKATITITSALNAEVSKAVNVTVKNLVKNKTYNKMVIALDKKKKTKKLSLASKVKASSLTFTSGKKKVAAVSKAGVVRGKKVGTAKITIKGKKSFVKGAKQVITLYVAKKSVKSVALNKENVTLTPNETVNLTTTVTPDKAANVVTYDTSDKNVAMVDQSGKVTAVNEGTAKITATTVDGNKKAFCAVVVKEGNRTPIPGETDDCKPPKNPENSEPGKPGDTTTPGNTESDKPGISNPDLPDISKSIDSEYLTNEGIQIANGDETLYLGEFITINAICYPYSWANKNDYILVSSDENVVTVDEGKVAYAVGEGKARITAYTTDGAYYDTIDVSVLPALDHSYESNKVYNVDLAQFQITATSTEVDPLTVDKSVAYNNCNGIMSAMKYAAVKGYDVVRLPKDSLIYIDPANMIYMKSGISLDLNGSELKIVPNAYANYQAIIFKEGNINAFAGFSSGNETTYDKYTNAKAYTFQSVGDSFFLNPIPVCEKNHLYDEGNYTGKWLEKGGSMEVVTSYVRDKNANLVIYGHYLKDGEEVGCDKISSLHGMSNNTLMKAAQTIQLSTEYNYDSVQLEFRAVYGDVCNYTFCDMELRSKPSEALNDSSIINGTITGERSTKQTTYPGWQSDSKTEGSCSIIFNQGINNGIKNVTVKDSVGFNMSSGSGSVGNRVYVSYTDLEFGTFDNEGKKKECTQMIRNSEYYDVSKWKTNKYVLGYSFGYQDVEKWSHSRIYDVYYYDENKNLISFDKGIMKFREYEMPEETCFINIAMYDSELPTSGDTDFGNSILMLEERDIPIRNFIVDCTIENNYSTGFAACGGQRWIIKGNSWKKNGGRMPGCDIDWEDGWNYMQCDMISDNEFLSYNNVITCAGMYSSAFHNNKFYGKSWIYPKSNFYSFVNNSFIKDTEKVASSTGSVNFGSRSDVWIANNHFTGGVIGNEVNHSNAEYRIRYVKNDFNGTSLNTNSRTDVYECSFTGKNGIKTETLTNCTFKDCENLTVGGTIRNCTLENVNLYPASGDYMKILSCNLYDTNIPSTANTVNHVLFDKCNITFDQKHSFMPTDKGLKEITVKDSTLEFKDANEKFVLFTGWDLTGSSTQALFQDNVVIKPNGFHGLLINASWMGQNTAENKFVLKLVNTNFDELEDANKINGNFEIIRNANE